MNFENLPDYQLADFLRTLNIETLVNTCSTNWKIHDICLQNNDLRERIRGYLILGRDVNQMTKEDKNNAMYTALSESNYEQFRYLLHNNRRLFVLNDLLTHAIIFRSNYNIIKYILDKNLRYISPDTLFAAIDYSGMDVISLLLDKGINPNVRSPNSSEETPLKHAILRGRPDVVRLLLERGANPMINFWIIIDSLVRAQNMEIVDIYLRYIPENQREQIRDTIMSRYNEFGRIIEL